jgi:tetratricopeptide (TPR) repeat protein
LGDDRVDGLLQLHDAALREALVEHRGREVKHTGDGMMAVFEASSDAVACAIAMHKAVVRATRREAAPLRLRVGLSAGDVTRTGDDYFGTPVNEAARLGAAAAPGEILVTEIVRLLAGSRGTFVFRDAGSRELKGLGTLATSSVDWTPDPPGAPLPAALASMPRTGFVGREAQTSLFATLWDDVAGGGRRVLLVAGEPGVGKSRLAAERAWSVHEEGATVLLGRCEDGVAAPYRPFAEALRQLIDSEADELGGWATTHGAHLGSLLPDLQERFGDIPAPAASDPETEQLRMFEAIVALFATVGARVPVLLVLDDLHWADRPSLLLLRHLVRSETITRLLVLGTYRETDLDRNHPLSGLLADLRSDDHTSRALLRGLDEPDTGVLVTAWAGRDVDAEFVHAIHRETEGNPFFVHQVLTHLGETGAVTRLDDGWIVDRPIDRLGIPEGVREVVGRRLSRLGERTNRVLGVASVIGREFDLPLLCSVADSGEDDALDALEPAIIAGLVEEVPGMAGRFEFTHALVRSTLAEELLTLRRVRLHQRIGEAIEAGPPNNTADRLAELAYHFTEAAPAGDVTKAVRYTTQLADSLAANGEFAAAQAAFERALQLLDAAGEPDLELRFEVLVGLTRTLSLGPDPREAWAPSQAALAIARRLGSMERLARAVRSLNIVGAVRFGNNFAQVGLDVSDFLAVVEELLAMAPSDDIESRALLLATRSLIFAASMPTIVERDRAEHDAREAARLAGQIDAPDAIAAANGAIGTVLTGDARVSDLLDATDAVIRAALTAGDTRTLAFGRVRAARARMQMGDRPATDVALAAAAELPILQDAGNASSRVFQQLNVAVAALEGRFDDAALIADTALQRTPHPGWAMFHFVQHQAIRTHRGRINPDVLDRVATQWPDVAALRSGAALAHAEAGDLEVARARFEALATDNFAVLTFGGGRPLMLRELAELCAHLDDKSHAASLHEFLTPYDGQLLVPYNGSSCEGAAARALGQLETVLGRFDDAEHHFDAALQLEEAFGGRALVPRTRYWYARMLQQRGHTDDLEHANQLLETVLAETDDLDMQTLHRLAAAARPRH